MRLIRLGCVLLVAAGLCGCMHTHRVEYHSESGTNVDGTGDVSSYAHATENERHWWGPWFLQTDRARP
jgi:hypothetical protein